MNITHFELIPFKNVELINGGAEPKTYKINEVCDMIEEAAKETGFIRWTSKWDEFFGERIVTKKQNEVIETLPDEFSIMNIVFVDYRSESFDRFIKRQNIYVNFYKDNSLLFLLDDPNDLNELSEFISIAFKFAKRFCTKLYSYPVEKISLPKELLSSIEEIRPLTVLLKEQGVRYHFSRDTIPKMIILDNNVKLCLMNNTEDDPEVFINTNSKYLSRLPKNTLIINTQNLKNRLEERGSELVKAIKAVSFASMFLEKKASHNYDQKSHKYDISLSWNIRTAEHLLIKEGYNILRSFDGYIAVSANNLRGMKYFRPSWKEINQVIENSFNYI